MSWQAAVVALLALVVAGGFAWYERSRPSARIVAAVAALAALGVAGRVVLAPVPNVVATTDVALLAGYALGGGPGFAVGALSGLVSNFWLGQGPWTPWQMAGWGLVGIAGAVLARASGREVGRWGLAAVAALAGLAYGALLDLSVMVQYGGEQSVDRYLALSARGIPFNVAHALGNAALMLAAGPAMVRMLGRYRERFDVAWRDAPLARSAVAVAVGLCLTLPLLAPVPARAGDEAKLKEKQKALAGLAGARAWLLGAQNDDGGFGAFKGDDSSPGMTGWAMIGLQAAGMNPRDATTLGKSPVQYLRKHKKKIKSTGDLERTILALDGAELDPRDFDGADLVERLRNRQRKDGSFERQVNLTAFAILAQRAGGVEKGNVGKAAQWLRSVQNKNGGWGSVADGSSEPDSTGAALQALAVAPGDDKPISTGAKWLERNQRGDGGWALTAGCLDELAVDRLGDPGPRGGGEERRRDSRGRQQRARLPASPPGRQGLLRLLELERSDAGLGDGAGDDRNGPRALPDRSRPARRRTTTPAAPARTRTGSAPVTAATTAATTVDMTAATTAATTPTTTAAPAARPGPARDPASAAAARTRAARPVLTRPSRASPAMPCPLRTRARSTRPPRPRRPTSRSRRSSSPRPSPARRSRRRRTCSPASGCSPRSSPPASSGTAAGFRSATPRGRRCAPDTLARVDVETAIRTRRTHKAYRPEPVERELLEELFELASWAPNHHLTEPWRFRVVGPEALEALKVAAGPEAAAKLDRAPTLVVVSATSSGEEPADTEDLLATGCAAYIVLLAAHGRGLAGYWRTPGVLRERAGRDAVGLGEDERFVGLLYLGRPIQDQRPPERSSPADTVTFLP